MTVHSYPIGKVLHFQPTLCSTLSFQALQEPRPTCGASQAIMVLSVVLSSSLLPSFPFKHFAARATIHFHRTHPVECRSSCGEIQLRLTQLPNASMGKRVIVQAWATNIQTIYLELFFIHSSAPLPLSYAHNAYLPSFCCSALEHMRCCNRKPTQAGCFVQEAITT